MVEAANRRQQGDACERTSASGTQGKNSTSSNETVIARASDSPRSSSSKLKGFCNRPNKLHLFHQKLSPTRMSSGRATKTAQEARRQLVSLDQPK